MPAPDPAIDWIAVLANLNARFDRLEKIAILAINQPAASYETTINLPRWLGGPQTLTIAPRPVGGDGTKRL